MARRRVWCVLELWQARMLMWARTGDVSAAMDWLHWLHGSHGRTTFVSVWKWMGRNHCRAIADQAWGVPAFQAIIRARVDARQLLRHCIYSGLRAAAKDLFRDFTDNNCQLYMKLRFGCADMALPLDKWRMLFCAVMAMCANAGQVALAATMLCIVAKARRFAMPKVTQCAALFDLSIALPFGRLVFERAMYELARTWDHVYMLRDVVRLYWSCRYQVLSWGKMSSVLRLLSAVKVVPQRLVGNEHVGPMAKDVREAFNLIARRMYWIGYGNDCKSVMATALDLPGSCPRDVAKCLQCQTVACHPSKRERLLDRFLGWHAEKGKYCNRRKWLLVVHF